MFCPHCGTNNPTGQFCTNCGSAISVLNAQTAVTQVSQNPGQIAPASPIQESNGFSTAAIVLGAISFLFLPVIFGPVGIILAAVGKSKNEPRAMVGLTVSIVGTVMGMVLGLIFTSGY